MLMFIGILFITSGALMSNSLHGVVYNIGSFAVTRNLNQTFTLILEIGILVGSGATEFILGAIIFFMGMFGNLK